MRVRSKGPYCSPMRLKPSKYPLSPLKKIRVSPSIITQEAQRVLLPSNRPRPEKCCEGVATNWIPSTSVPCHQSSWRILLASIPHLIRVSPTPNGVRKYLGVGD